MQKKDFWKGFGAAFVLLAVIYFGGQFLAQMNIALPFGMSNTAKIRQIEEMLDTYYVEDYDKELAEELMYTGLVAGVGDPYTYYLSADSLAEQVEKNSGHFVGIGVEIYAGDDGYIVVSSVTPGVLRKRLAFWQKIKSQKWMAKASPARRQQMFLLW